jgi:hypothetical protein
MRKSYRDSQLVKDEALVAVTTIDADDLLDEMCVTPGNFHYWSSVTNDLYQKFKQSKSELDRLKGVVFQNIKTSAATKLTVAELEYAVQADAQVIAAESHVQRIERDYRDALAVTEAVRIKSDMLRTLAATKRAELSSL